MNKRTAAAAPPPPSAGRRHPRVARGAAAATLGALLMLAGAGATAAPAATAAAARAPAGVSVPMRLSPDVQPTAYRLHLDIDPARPTHQGEVQIDLRLARPLPAPGALRLHARDLQLSAIWLEQGPHRLAGRARRLNAEQVELRFGRALPAGPARLTLHFAGALQERDVDGLFRQREGGRWSAYTQFEPVGARRTFPLFDEPGFKVPWTLSLGVPDDLLALSNTAALSEQPDGPGRKRVQFATTPPLPSYLLAFAVGDFELREAGDAPTRTPVPLRLVVPRGRGAEAEDAARLIGPVLRQLEDWFDQPYPYAKLDSLAIPVTSGFEAMEHPGLVTYASSLLLTRPGERTPDFERALLGTVAHELAHQWFGNLVTPAWWDDLWLNESFASWLGDKVGSALRPDLLRPEDAAQDARRRAMREDRLVAARPIQQRIARDEDMGHLFSAITYAKGQAVLAMFETWLGAERLQAGVRRYIARHAWGLAGSADFYAALGSEDEALPEALRSFTTQAGIPRLRVALHCGDGQPPRLRLSQRRLLPLGATAPDGAPPLWQLPLRVRTPAGEARLVLRTAEAELLLPLPAGAAPAPGTPATAAAAGASEASATAPQDAAPCPAWVQANAGGTGYWRSAYEGDGLLRLTQAPGLPVGEWLALLDDAQGLHEAGELDGASLLAVARAGAAHADARVVAASAALLHSVARLVPDARRSAYAARWRADFGARAQALGWLPRPADDADTRRLRDGLLPLLADWGEDGALRAEARRLAEAWLADRAALPAEARGAVLAAAAEQGDTALFDALERALRQGQDRRERHDLLAALGRFRAPALSARALALLLDPALDPREALWPLLIGQTQRPATRAAALAFVQQQQGPFTARLARDALVELPRAFEDACSPAEAAQLRAVFGPRVARYPGGAESLALTLEAVQGCSAWAARQAPGLTDAL